MIALLALLLLAGCREMESTAQKIERECREVAKLRAAYTDSNDVDRQMRACILNSTGQFMGGGRL